MTAGPLNPMQLHEMPPRIDKMPPPAEPRAQAGHRGPAAPREGAEARARVAPLQEAARIRGRGKS